MDDVVEGATGTESPAVTTGTDTSAGTQNTGSQVNGQQITEKPAPFHLHPRWQQMVQRQRTSDATIQQMTQRLARFEQAGQQQNGRTVDPDRQEAIKALRELFADDPDLRQLLDAGKLRQAVQQLQQTTQGLQGAHTKSMVQTVRSEINTLAKGASLPTSDKALRAYEELIASEIRESPELLDRLRQGDLTAVREAFANVQASVGEFRRSDAVTTTAAKNATRALPPRSSGGTPAPPGQAPLTMKPGQDPRDFRREMHKSAREGLRALLEG